ncbi:MAG TPA: sulfite exporter TauE/SafE family protein [Nordella sp.]|nr:sulfite exporter TauE/SafE family protein [Nordella sp.]
MDGGLFFYAIALVAVVLVGASKGGLPVVGMLGVPVLALATSPVHAAGLLLPIFVVTDMFGLWAYRREFDRRNLMILIPATTLGVAIGWATASLVSDRLVTLLVGVIGLAFSLNYWLRGRHAVEPHAADIPRGVFWGTVSGFTSFVSHAGAPPYQMYVLPQRLDKMIYAGTTTILFAVVNAVKLVPYWALGQLSLANLKTVAVLFPFAIAATFTGVKLTRILPQDIFYRLVIGALFLVSLKLVYAAALG